MTFDNEQPPMFNHVFKPDTGYNNKPDHWESNLLSRDMFISKTELYNQVIDGILDTMVKEHMAIFRPKSIAKVLEAEYNDEEYYYVTDTNIYKL